MYDIMEVEVYITEKTQHYKDFINDTTEDIIEKKSDETVIFSNGMKAVFNLVVWYSYKCEYFLQFNDFIITRPNSKELEVGQFKGSLCRLIERTFFDVTVFDKFKYTLNDALNGISEKDYNSDPDFYNEDFYITEKTEHYKEHVNHMIRGNSRISDDKYETVIFKNGIKACFPFSIQLTFECDSVYQQFWFSCMKLTVDDKEIHDENIKNIVNKIIRKKYFDNFIDEILLMRYNVRTSS
jgi:hypothetical protein